MNKGFFVVFLGIILGAMALIFVNQTSGPVAVTVPAQQAATPESGSGASGQGAGTVSVAAAPQSAPQPGPARPETPKPETPKPETPRPEAPKPEAPKPEAPKPETPKPEAPKPEAPKPEAPKPATPKPEVAAPVTPKPEAPKPEAPKPEAPKPETTAMTPVTSKPETQTNPGGAQTKKSLTLVNISLHFRGGGMALRIEADAPFSYKTFALPSPDRYVIDLVGTWSNMRAPTVPSNNMIKSARAGKQAGGPRLVLDMMRAPKKHNVVWVSPTVLEIVIE